MTGGNLAAILDQAAMRYGDRTAVVAGSRSLTYRALSRRVDMLAERLRDAGVQPDDKIALSCPNVPEFTVAYWAIIKVGAVVVPLNVMLRAREIAGLLADSDAVAYVVHVDPASAPMLAAARDAFAEAPGCHDLWLLGEADGMTTFRGETLAGHAGQPVLPASREDDDTAVIIFTSGTTGRPKGAELTHRNLRLNAHAVAAVYEVDPVRPDVFLLAAPLFHSLGQTCVQNAAIASGSQVVMMRRFAAAEALRAILDEQVTIFAGVPTMYWALLGAFDDLPDADRLVGRLRVAASGGAPLPAEVHRDFEERFGTTILEGYGLSETSPMATSARRGERPRIGSIGRPIAGVRLKLIGEDQAELPDTPDVVGEIAIRGPNVMKGYYRRPEATARAIRDGWLRTGDLARRDADGFYYIVGRSKELIIRGGYNVYPREIEEALMEHPGVSLVAVVGVPHASHGQEVKAVVVPTPGSEPTAEELLAWGRQRLAAYKYPRIIELRAELPISDTGKVLKRLID